MLETKAIPLLESGYWIKIRGYNDYLLGSEFNDRTYKADNEVIEAMIKRLKSVNVDGFTQLCIDAKGLIPYYIIKVGGEIYSWVLEGAKFIGNKKLSNDFINNLSSLLELLLLNVEPLK